MKPFIILFALLLYSAFTLTCMQGFVPNSLNICIEPRFIEGCNQYLSETQCKVCDYRYVLTAKGLCEIDSESTEECCSLRAADNSCLKCKLGLYLIDGKCQQSTIIGCLEKDNRGICLNCASDFYLKNGRCEKSVKDCVQYSDESRVNCTSCAFGHSLINNFCVANSILGCKHEIDHICKECMKPFILNEGNCEIRNCKGYNDYRCVTCNCGFYLTLEGLCKPIELGCIRYQRGQCTDCYPSYKLKGNQCEIEGCLDKNGIDCKKCSGEYELVNGGCNMKNCEAWKDGVCEICQKGYNYQSGKCILNKYAQSE